ncbi:hypothetical protein [Aeromonas veronii]|uniref:hypothetical protein n=1 Tax=Aeromonas veronii TaxID=654 RepID=UPI001F197B8A|nr:hypothetical protein [Aeromonas veronii]MCF5899960.1 hypothetical protein [Aeromonas veronii]
MPYNRWISADPNKIAYRIFKKHHCEINDYLWSYVPLESFGSYIVRNEKEKNIHELFFVGGPDAKRVYTERHKWRKDIESFSKWTNINALVSILSYFEFYMKRICYTAIMSDPGLIIGSSRAVDGTINLKNDIEIPIDVYVERITKGAWCDRAKSFESLFKWVPDSINENLKSLDNMRNIRNRAAHAFGRNLNDIFIEKHDDMPMDKLRIDKLKSYMSLVDDIVTEIDGHLLNNHIGEFELIHLLHKNKNKLHGFNNEKARQIKKLLNASRVGNSRNIAFCEQLVEYYYDIR